MLNACTLELDEPEIAVKEILGQLNLEENAKKYSAGFLTCSYDFVEAGIVKAICEALPFDVVGCTTLTNANNNEAGTMLLCLTVLTADDCNFAAALTDSVQPANLEKTVASAVKKLPEGKGKAKLALVFLPMLDAGGEIMIETLDKCISGAPIFGTVACDLDTAAFSNSFVIHNGEHYKERISFLLIYGNVSPKFVVASASENYLRKQASSITSSEGSILKRVNNMPAKEYFESIGLVTNKGIEGLCSVPFVVDYNDGTQPIARAIYGLNPDGSAACGGRMPEGGSFYIGLLDVEDIISTAKSSAHNLSKPDRAAGIIMFPCLGRNMVLAIDPLMEVNAVREIIGGDIPWHLAYSGGECCPVYTREGSTVNRFHNFTFIGCRL